LLVGNGAPVVSANNNPIVSTGNSTVAAQPGTNVTGSASTPVGWQQDSFVFTAGAATQRLSFLATGGPNGKPPFALLSGVSVVQTPEPEDFVGTLIGIGFVGTLVRSRLVKKKLADKD
jgi:hypothetical protein